MPELGLTQQDQSIEALNARYQGRSFLSGRSYRSINALGGTGGVVVDDNTIFTITHATANVTREGLRVMQIELVEQGIYTFITEDMLGPDGLNALEE